MMIAEQRERDEATGSGDDLRAFLVLAVRPALLQLVSWIERRYGLLPRRNERER